MQQELPMAEYPDLKVEEGDCTTLSPNSERFKGAFEQIRPRTAAQVREILGFSSEAAAAVEQAGMCCHAGRGQSSTASAEDLEAKDDELRAVARATTYGALRAYVQAANPAAYAHMEPAFEKYLDINRAIINVLHVNDIEVFDDATLTVSANTHVLRARKIIIHPRGRIVCNGSTTFKVTSLEGLRRRIVGDVAQYASASVRAVLKK